MKLDSLQLNRDSKSLTIKTNVDFEQFEQFAESLVLAIDSRVLDRQWGADRHQWLLEFEGTHMQLNYEFYGDICWLSVENDNEFEVLEYLTGLLEFHI